MKERYCSKETVKQKPQKAGLGGKHSDRERAKRAKKGKHGSVSKGAAKGGKGAYSGGKKRGSSLKEFLNRIEKEEKTTQNGNGKRREMLKNVISPNRKNMMRGFLAHELEKQVGAIVNNDKMDKFKTEAKGKRNLGIRLEKRAVADQAILDFKNQTLGKAHVRQDMQALTSRNDYKSKNYLQPSSGLMLAKKKNKKHSQLLGIEKTKSRNYPSQMMNVEDIIKGKIAQKNVKAKVKAFPEQKMNSKRVRESDRPPLQKAKTMNLFRGSYNFKGSQNEKSYGLKTNLYNSVKTLKPDQIRNYEAFSKTKEQNRNSLEYQQKNVRKRVSSFKASKRRGNSRTRSGGLDSIIQNNGGYQMKTLNDFLASNMSKKK
jgi:hypothetical protein